MKKIISIFLLLLIATVGFAACANNTDAFADDSAELYAARREVVYYLVEEGELTEEEADQDLNLYCQRIGDCTFGTGVCDGTGAERCLALGLSEEQIAEYVAQRKVHLDACVEDGLMTQEEADLLLSDYELRLTDRANAITGNQQTGVGICQNEGTCSGIGNNNRYCKGKGRR